MAPSLFSYSLTSRIHDIDAAGVMFFARYFYHIHDAYEELLNHHGVNIKQILNSDIILPITHTQADFKDAIILNEVMTIEICLQEIAADYFILNYQFIDSHRVIKATAQTRHVCLNSKSKQRQPLPDAIYQMLTHN